MHQRYLIKNVQVWNADGVVENTDLLIESGIVQEMKKGIDDSSIPHYDLTGKGLIPLGVDLQVHLRVPGQPKKEIAETGLRAALRGGVGAVLTMPNTAPYLDSVEAIEQGKKELEKWDEKLGVEVLWSACITRKMLGKELVDVESLSSYVHAFTDDGLGVESDDLMEKIFKATEGTEIPVLQHAEYLGHGAALAPGPVQKSLGLKAYPAEAEWKMVERDLRLLEKYPNARYHVLHVSSRETLDLLRDAQARGLKASGEVTPHHLFFNSEDIHEDNKSFKMNPPIRSKEDQEALWEALSDGTLEYVATDHAPHEATMKKGSFSEVAFGTTGLETFLRVLFWGVKNKKITPQRLVEVFSLKPAEFIGISDRFGKIKEGFAFQAIEFDLTFPEKTVIDSDLVSLSHNSCFLGSSLPHGLGRVFNTKGIWFE
ncbi:MAG: dihydroorotase [Bdellovibrionaceae bacterium]|nr:dihydroorotase [Pseudobdellovibrionaceae bacterium]|tara:strand:+ start:4307 stop:5590 length:1284 start_codon:yes stop_codon:yes gene_type:complete